MKKQLKIIFIIDSLTSGGAERVMSVLANEFSKLGYKVSIFAKVHKTPFYELDKEVNVIFPSNEINYKTPITTLLGRLFVYNDIYKFLKKEKPDLVIPFSTSTNGVVIPICKFLRLKVIACEHNNYKVNLNKFPVWFIKRWIYPLADKLTVLTERDKEQYYNSFMKNVVVMPNPLPLEPINESNGQIRKKIILAIGNIKRWEHKGFDNLINIFRQISVHNPEWKLQIAGGGDAAYLTGLINKYELNCSIELLGEVKNIQTLMQQSSIFVLTSRWEGLPMVLIEAMSQGMACIAFDCFSGPGDILSHEKDGILIEDQNNKEFSVKLSCLMNDEVLRIQLGKNAIETSKNYLPHKIVAQWQSLIE